MCDTILAMPATTAGQTMLFGKNSDRQRNEAQTVEYVAAAEFGTGAELKCTYITIPQVSRTHAMILCRPFWIWGAEMGANERGVAIGNEAVFARMAPSEEPALIGMDLLRLALERADTAAQAVDVITTLLERHGQGGNCGHLQPSFYHNAFLIADPTEAFVLETVGREWLVERVVGVRSISNAYSIERAERVSAGLASLIRESGWSTEAEPLYAQVLADPHKQHIGSAKARRQCSSSLLAMRTGRLNASDMMRILRDHGSGDDFHSEWLPDSIAKRTLCLHAGTEDTPGQTVGSLVSELRGKDAVHWVTGTAAPCLSIFKPVLLDTRLPSHGSRPTGDFDERSLWWRHERLHRAALLGDTAEVLARIRPERDALEETFRGRVAEVLKGGSPVDRARVIAQCWQEAIEAEDRWFSQVVSPPPASTVAMAATWERMNQISGLRY